MSCIVILDDRSSNRNIYSKLAATLGEDVRIEVFSDPEGALTWLQDHTVNLIITDFKMPGMNGAEFIRRFRALPDTGDPAIIVITVYEERSFRLQALEAGATDFLISPVDHYEFIARARNLLAHHALLQDNSRQIANLERLVARSQPLSAHALCSLSETLGQIIETVPVLLSATGLDGTILFVNTRQAEASGVDAALVIGQPATSLFGPERGLASHELDRQVLCNGETIQQEESVTVFGLTEECVLETTKSLLKNASGEIIGVLTSSIDVTRRARNEAELRWNELHDLVSGLPNRRYLVRCIEHICLLRRRSENGFALHRFDCPSHEDPHTIKKALDTYLRGDDVLAHFGGNDFCIMQSRANNAEEAAQFARQINLVLNNKQKIGIALHPEHGNDANKLIKFAEKNLYSPACQPKSVLPRPQTQDFSERSKKNNLNCDNSYNYDEKAEFNNKTNVNKYKNNKKHIIYNNKNANDNNNYLERCE